MAQESGASIELMVKKSAHSPSLDWPREVSPREGDELSPLERFVNDQLLPRLGELNRPTKILEPHGLLWGASKSRGVKAGIVVDDHRVYTRNGRVVGGREGSATSLTSDLAQRLLQSKTETLDLMKPAGLRVPEGRTFGPDEDAAAVRYAQSLGWPVAVKPDGRSAGRGVSTGVTSAERFAAAWKAAAAALDSAEALTPRSLHAGPAPAKLLVERDDRGIGLRVFVAGEAAQAALVRLPMFVIGDGCRTVLALARGLQSWRSQNIYLNRMEVSEAALLRRLARLGIDPDHVPAAGHLVVVQESPNLHGGGLTVDVTGLLVPKVLDLAVEARWAIPGLLAAGIDLSIQGIRDAGATVIGVNDRANHQIHRYPAFGQSRNVTEGVVDMFLRSAG